MERLLHRNLIFLGLCIGLLSGLVATRGYAQRQLGIWYPNGVSFLQKSGDTLFMAGASLTNFSKPVGSAIFLAGRNLTPSLLPFRVLSGTVSKIVEDGTGGYIVSGSSVQLVGNDTLRTGVFRLNNRGEFVFSYSQQVQGGSISNFGVANGRVGICGNFLTINGVSRRYFAVFSLVDNSVLPINPIIDEPPFRIELAGNTALLFGNFTRIGSVPAENIGMVNLTTGLPYATQPNLRFGVSPLRLNMYARGNSLYIIGRLERDNASPDWQLTRINGLTGVVSHDFALPAWVVQNTSVKYQVYSLAFTRGSVYINQVLGNNNFRIHKVDSATGSSQIDVFGPSFQVSEFFTGMGDLLYDLPTTQSGATPIQFKVRNASDLQLTTLPASSLTGTVSSFSVINGNVLANGTFFADFSPVRNRMHIYSERTGRVLDTIPRITPFSISDMVKSGTKLYFLCFQQVNIDRRGRTGYLVYDYANDNQTTENPSPEAGTIFSLKLNGERAIVGGGFTQVGRQSRAGAAVLDQAFADAVPPLLFSNFASRATYKVMTTRNGNYLLARGDGSSVPTTYLDEINSTTGDYVRTWSILESYDQNASRKSTQFAESDDYVACLTRQGFGVTTIGVRFFSKATGALAGDVSLSLRSNGTVPAIVGNGPVFFINGVNHPITRRTNTIVSIDARTRQVLSWALPDSVTNPTVLYVDAEAVYISATVPSEYGVPTTAVIKYDYCTLSQGIITASGSTTWCQGENRSVTLTAQPVSGSCIWSNGATTASITVSAPGAYSYRYIVDGCTSSVSDPVFVEIRSLVNVTMTASICPGRQFDFFGRPLSQPGTYTQVVRNRTGTGCDTLYTLNLSQRGNLTFDEEVTICSGSSYEFDNRVLTAAGVYTRVRRASTGCDTVYTLTLIIAPPIVITQNRSICPGQQIRFFGSEYTQQGVYNFTKRAAGPSECDTIFRLNLAVLPSFSRVINRTICPGGVFIFGSRVLRNTGTYQDVSRTRLGCDSITTLNLTVNQPGSSRISRFICNNQVYDFNRRLLFRPGTYIDTVPNLFGCDSIVVLDLQVLPTSSVVVADTICGNDTYSFNGQQLTRPGRYAAFLVNSAGCDSSVTLDLRVNQPVLTQRQVSICQGGRYSFGNRDLTTAGLYADTLRRSNGCDSIAQVLLRVLPNYDTTVVSRLCSGGTFRLGNRVISLPGNYVENLVSSGGCDSTVRLLLSIQNPENFTLERSICANRSLSFGNQILRTAGSYTQRFANRFGCDSTVTINLTVRPTSSQIIERSICQGDTLRFNNQSITRGGVYFDTLANATGCDSLVILQLSIRNASFSTLDAAICEGDSYLFRGRPLTIAGLYRDTAANARGCDSIISLRLIVNPLALTTLSASICLGQGYPFGSTILRTPGVYRLRLQNRQGCDSSVVLSLSVLSSRQTSLFASICKGGSYQFRNRIVRQRGVYIDTLRTVGGCDSLVVLQLDWLPEQVINSQASFCAGQAYPFNGRLLFDPGVYRDSARDALGCWSYQNLTLTTSLPPQRPQVAIRRDTLVVTTEGEAFIWLRNSTALQGQRTNRLVADTVSNYQVISLNAQGCPSDTSEIIRLRGLPKYPAYLAIYPNPFKQVLNISFVDWPSTTASIELHDALGRLVEEWPLVNINADNRQVQLQTSLLPNGIYTIKIKGPQGIQTFKAVHTR